MRIHSRWKRNRKHNFNQHVSNQNEYENIRESNFYQNNNYFLLSFFDKRNHHRPIKNNTEEEIPESSRTNHIYQNTSNKTQLPKEKISKIPFLLESPKNKGFQTPDLEIDFLLDSGAESNIINIPKWNEIQILHPKLKFFRKPNNLATAQGSSLTIYGKIPLLLVPTRTMEQNKLLSKLFKQKFHITDIKHNIVVIPLITK